MWHYAMKSQPWICFFFIWAVSCGSGQILGLTYSGLAMPYVDIQYIPRNMHTVFALLCFVVVIHWLIFPYPSGLLHWHCGNLTIAPVPAKQPWWIWINTSCEFIMNDCITTTKQSTTKPCAYFLGYTVALDQYWLMSLLVAGQHQAFTWASADLSSKVYCGIHMKVITREMLMNIFCNMCSKITLLESLPHAWGTSELSKQHSLQSGTSLLPRLLDLIGDRDYHWQL